MRRDLTTTTEAESHRSGRCHRQSARRRGCRVSHRPPPPDQRTFGPAGHWTNALAAAAVVTTAPAATEILTAAVADRLKAVDAYVAPVRLTPEHGVLPGNLR